MPNKLPQHPFVKSVRSAPSQPTKKTVVLIGLPGDSDQPEQQRLYLTAKLNYYVEFPVSAILSTETVPPDQSPIAGQEATQVTISRDATVRYVTETSPRPIDEFDLDVRLGAAGGPAAVPTTRGGEATCIQDGCPTDATCHVTECRQHTCANTCRTCAGHATCAGAATCVNTQCQQATCVNTQCGQHTCVNTQCGQHTCAATCPNTCAATCANTCAHTCAGVHCITVGAGHTCRLC